MTFYTAGARSPTGMHSQFCLLFKSRVQRVSNWAFSYQLVRTHFRICVHRREHVLAYHQVTVLSTLSIIAVIRQGLT